MSESKPSIGDVIRIAKRVQQIGEENPTANVSVEHPDTRDANERAIEVAREKGRILKATRNRRRLESLANRGSK